jgi:hypothetical protein
MTKLGNIYDLMIQELLHVASANLPRPVHLCSSYDTVSNIDEFLKSDLAVLTNTLNQYLS